MLQSYRYRLADQENPDGFRVDQKIERIMKKVIVGAIALSFLLVGCQKGDEKNNDSSSALEAKGGKSYGGVLTINENEFFKNLFPHSIVGAVSNRIASQMYEGLFTFNEVDLSTEKRLCEDFTVSENGLIYTFSIKKGVYFHDDACFPDGKGRELKADDIKFCFTQLCTQKRSNQGFSIFDGSVKGANEYYEASANDTPDFEVEGIKVIDDYTIQIELLKPNALFTTNLARPFGFIFPKEAYSTYGMDMREKVVGTGPFMLQSIEDDHEVLMKRNPNYHGVDEVGNKLPFLDAIKVRFIPDKKTELFEFKKGSIDMIYRLPTEHIIEILEATISKNGEYSNYLLQHDPEMTTHILGFQTKDDLFKDINVRKAFSFAVDRVKILEYVLNGEGSAPGIYGITPPIEQFKKNGYDATTVKGYSYQPDSAKYYLSKAGFANGKGFPNVTLDLNSGGERNTNVALEVTKQLKECLNVNVEINVVPMAQHIDNMQHAKTNFFRVAWGADVPNAENFVWLLYGKSVPATMEETSYPNLMRYQNPEFDALYEAGVNAISLDEANQNFMKAEQLAMNDAPLIVLWYDEGYRLLQSYVKGCPNNPMQFRDFSVTYLEKAEKLKEATN